MKKWAFLSVAAAAVVIGCGGSSHKGGSTDGSTTSGIPGTNLRVTNVGDPDSNGVSYGVANFMYLTGQGRAPDDLVAVIRSVTLEDQYGTVVNSGAGTVAFNLKSFEIGNSALDVPFTGQNSRLFESYELRFDRFYFEGSPNSTLNAPGTDNFDARIRVFPGRETTVPIFLDDSMFTVSGSNVDFDRDNFIAKNISPDPDSGVSAIRSFLGDYVAFDISSLPTAERPQLGTGDFAGKFFISGDNYAIGQEGSAGSFEVFTEDSQRFEGTYGPERFINQYTPGSYTLYQVDPSDINNLAKIVSIKGSFRSTTRVLSNLGSFEMITFPTIRDNSHQELVMGTFDGNGHATSLYFGFLDFTTGKFEAHPVRAIADPTDFSGVLYGKVSDMRNKNNGFTTSPDAVRYGTYTFDSNQTLPSGFQNQGTFVVFRR